MVLHENFHFTSSIQQTRLSPASGRKTGNRKKERATQTSSVSPSAAAFFFLTFFSRRGFTKSSLSS